MVMVIFPWLRGVLRNRRSIPSQTSVCALQCRAVYAVYAVYAVRVCLDRRKAMADVTSDEEQPSVTKRLSFMGNGKAFEERKGKRKKKGRKRKRGFFSATFSGEGGTIDGGICKSD